MQIKANSPSKFHCLFKLCNNVNDTVNMYEKGINESAYLSCYQSHSLDIIQPQASSQALLCQKASNMKSQLVNLSWNQLHSFRYYSTYKQLA